MAILTPKQVRACIHPRQGPRFALAVIVSIMLLPLMAMIAVFGVIFLFVPLLVFLIWFSFEVLYATLLGNSVEVSELNYPRIAGLLEEMKADLGVEKRIDVFVYANGDFNAAMARLFFRRAIFLNSEILETEVSDDEVRWLVGRFVGYWRARQDAGIGGWLVKGAELLVVFNVFIWPYRRAMVYTGDRLALAAINGDLSSSISVMQKLLVGRTLGYSVNPVGIVEQHRKVKGSFFAFMARLSSAYPHLTARYVDLIHFGRNAFPERYRIFAAANPGLPRDMHRLSSEAAPMVPPEQATA